MPSRHWDCRADTQRVAKLPHYTLGDCEAPFAIHASGQPKQPFLSHEAAKLLPIVQRKDWLAGEVNLQNWSAWAWRPGCEATHECAPPTFTLPPNVCQSYENWLNSSLSPAASARLAARIGLGGCPRLVWLAQG